MFEQWRGTRRRDLLAVPGTDDDDNDDDYDHDYDHDDDGGGGRQAGRRRSGGGRTTTTVPPFVITQTAATAAEAVGRHRRRAHRRRPRCGKQKENIVVVHGNGVQAQVSGGFGHVFVAGRRRASPIERNKTDDDNDDVDYGQFY